MHQTDQFQGYNPKIFLGGTHLLFVSYPTGKGSLTPLTTPDHLIRSSVTETLHLLVATSALVRVQPTLTRGMPFDVVSGAS